MSDQFSIRSIDLSLDPEELDRASIAFKGAWDRIVTRYGCDVTGRPETDCHRLATIVMEMAQNNTLTIEEIADAAIDRLRTPTAVSARELRSR